VQFLVNGCDKENSMINA